MSLKKSIKKIERKFFDLFKFDMLGYRYKKPQSNKPRELRLALLEDYFKNQPSGVGVAVIGCYLFFKKSALFVLRRVKRLMR